MSSRVEEAQNQSNDLEHKEATNQNNKKKKNPKKGDNVRTLWDNFNCSNICIIRGQKEKGKSKKLEIYLKKQ